MKLTLVFFVSIFLPVMTLKVLALDVEQFLMFIEFRTV